MTILEELERRRARRAMREEPVEAGILERILEAGTLAPSCFNNQPWRIVAVARDLHPERHAAVAATLTPGNAWALRAPVYLALCTKASLDCRMDEGRDYAYFDLGQAALAIQLQAVREGLYAHPIAGFAAARLRQAAGIPQDLVPLCMIILGWPDSPSSLPENLREKEVSGRTRKPRGDVVSLEGTAPRAWG